MKKKKIDKFITRDRMAQRVALEILIHRCPDLTIKRALSISRDMSVQIRNILSAVEKEKLSLTDEQANSESFWIQQIKNSGKDFNQNI
jgi:hypothetical protein